MSLLGEGFGIEIFLSRFQPAGHQQDPPVLVLLKLSCWCSIQLEYFLEHLQTIMIATNTEQIKIKLTELHQVSSSYSHSINKKNPEQLTKECRFSWSDYWER